jgi:Spy/CpxP family protein refolding chaperone
MAQGPGAMAQRQRARAAVNADALKQYLNLTDSQVEQLRTARKDLAQANKPVLDQIREKAQALRQEMKSDKPDSTKVGQLTVELKALREQIRTSRDGLGAKTRAILSPEQQAKLKNLEEAQKLAPAIRQAVALGLIDAPEGAPAARAMLRRAFGRARAGRL